MKVTAEIRDLTEVEKSVLRLAAMPFSEAWESHREDFEGEEGEGRYFEIEEALNNLGLTDNDGGLTAFGKAALEQIGGAT